VPAEARLAADFREARRRTEALVAPLEAEDYVVQPSEDASPPKWHLAHTTWFFETFLLRPFQGNYSPFAEHYEYLFNSYYNGVGKQFPRPLRGTLSRPTLREVQRYRAEVDAGVESLLAAPPPEHRDVIRSRTILGIHHEEQHQELIATDVKRNLGANPVAPIYGGAHAAPTGRVGGLTFSGYAGGLVEIGARPCANPASRDAFVFDNETPRHRVFLEPFSLADRLITCGEFLEFIADAGYRRPELWLADGWAHLGALGEPWEAPLYWFRDAGEWFEYTLAGVRPVDAAAPVVHVSFYEADAFARWAGYRLPTEAEWEHAAGMTRHSAAEGAWLETGTLQPTPDPGGPGPRQLLGDAWEWTASAYRPYPGFRSFAGALGEYNGKFMCNQMVLRGGSCATPRAHARVSYRNFFYPPDRWQFSGIRLAADGA